MEQHFKALVDLIRILFLFLLNGVLVDGFQHVVRGVSNTFLSVFIGDTSGQHNGGVHVPQIVKAEMGDTCFFTDPSEAVIHGVAGECHNMVLRMILLLD